MLRVCLKHLKTDITTKRDKEMRKKKMMIRHYNNIISIIMLATMLLAACGSGSDGIEDTPSTTSSEAPKEIRVNTNLTKMLTRATTIDDNTAFQSYHLKIDAYYHDTETAYLLGKTLHYDSSWKFWDTSTSTQEHYYWPFEGSTVAGGSTTASTLDFVGFCPYEKPAYIGTPTYNHETGVLSFTCDMSNYMTLARQTGAEEPTIPTMQEFLVSVLPNQTLATQTAAGGALPMVFKHPFALIKFTITAASGTHVQINSISIDGLNTGGTCTYNGSTMTWGSYSGSATMTIAQVLKNGGTTESTPFVVIPNDYGTKYLTVNATWDDWSNPVTISDYGTNVTFNWQPGYIYTYNLTLDEYGLMVDISKFTEQW